MRRKPDTALKAGELQFTPDARGKPRVRGGELGPDTFVEPAKDHDISRLQLGLKQAPDEHTRMAAIAGADRDPFHELAQQLWQGGERHGLRAFVRPCFEFRDQRGKLTPRLPGPNRISSQRRRHFTHRCDHSHEIRNLRVQRLKQSCRLGPPLSDGLPQRTGALVTTRQELGHPLKPRRRTGPTQREVKPTRAIEPVASPFARTHERVFEESQKGSGRKMLNSRIHQRKDQRAIRRGGQALPG